MRTRSGLYAVWSAEVLKNQECKIIHTDDCFYVVNKPGGLLAVPGRGAEKQDCVERRMLNLFPDSFEEGLVQPAVHRLDLHTSGIMVLARSRDSFRYLAKQFENRQVKKEYIAILEGQVVEESGIIDLCFRLDVENRPHQIYDPINGKRGISRWEKIGDFEGRSRIRFFPETGRTHQLRLHSSHELGLGIPIAGDFLYGRGQDGDPMLLHASEISFIHPNTNQRVTFRSEPGF
ncbi:MAG: RluA family pseudouridine synthase [bacterium]|nr:RluA family pseudouridine synthase [bacterium]